MIYFLPTQYGFKTPSPYLSYSCSPDTCLATALLRIYDGGWQGWHLGDLPWWVPQGSPVQTKWWDQTHWECHFLTFPKVIQLFLLVKRFWVSLLSHHWDMLVCEWVCWVPPAAQTPSTCPPHCCSRSTAGGPADNQDPLSYFQATRPERGCWGRNYLSDIQQRSTPIQHPSLQSVGGLLCVSGRQSYRKHGLSELWVFSTRNRAHMSSRVWNNTGQPAKECPLSHPHLYCM